MRNQAKRADAGYQEVSSDFWETIAVTTPDFENAAPWTEIDSMISESDVQQARLLFCSMAEEILATTCANQNMVEDARPATLAGVQDSSQMMLQL